MTAVGRAWRRAKPRPETAAAFVVLSVVELVALAAFLAATPGAVTAPRYLLYPFVWLNVALLAVWRTRAPPATARRRALAVGVGLAYFLVLAWAGDLVGVAHHGTDVTVYWGLPPGWGPLVVATVGPVQVAPTPYQTAGYLALAYLAYATVLDAAASPAGLVAGTFSCVSCTLPVLATVVSSVAGGAAAFGAATAMAYDLSTGVFLVAVALLVWRPDVAAVVRLR